MQFCLHQWAVVSTDLFMRARLESPAQLGPHLDMRKDRDVTSMRGTLIHGISRSPMIAIVGAVPNELREPPAPAAW